MLNRFKYMNETGMSLTMLKNMKKCPECGNDMWIGVTEPNTYHCIKCDKSYRMTENGLKEKTIIGKRFRP